MFDYTVQDNRLHFTLSAAIPLDSLEVADTIAEVDAAFPPTALWKDFKAIYDNERQKWLEKNSPDTSAVKLNLDTAPLDEAISKADALIAKLKTAQKLIHFCK